ncbi:hypothetical protein [Paraburkholderia caribensis]|uniref:hypothetical protein n=1 Tax=Paraburkholderia caribensis TaxID=75105 RepID=UPI0031D0220B
MRSLVSLSALLVVLILGACVSHDAYRTHLIDAAAAHNTLRCPADVHGATVPDCKNVTPEIFDDKYELHFVEFDDQGWLHPASNPDDTTEASDQSSRQVDALMARLKQLLQAGTNLKVIVFVHGWKHNASLDDANVKDFRRLLERAASDELPQSAPRKVIGIYVGWRGKPWKIPEPLLNLSFWSRKDTASRVSVGSVREMFARIRSLQRYFNTQAVNEDAPERMRTLMIGHSFGGLILYAATAGPLIEVLTAREDLAGLPPLHSDRPGSKKRYEETERIADMIVLVNPAFEASRFQALYRVANENTHTCYEPPLLMSITSETDEATKVAFPAGRFINTLFERPTSSEEQATAIKRTPGHMPPYITHMLHGTTTPSPIPTHDETTSKLDETCGDWTPASKLLTLEGEQLANAVKENRIQEVKQSTEFIKHLNASGADERPWTRTFCGGARLDTVKQDGAHNAQTLVWNILADSDIIDGHNDVMNPALLDFVRQMFRDTELSPELTNQCISQ